MKLYNYFPTQDLDGSFFGVLTSSERVIDCERIIWTKVNGLQAIIKSPGCCRNVHSPQYYSDHVTFIVTTINPRPGCLQTNETVSFKVISTTKIGDNFCITFTACRGERKGVYEICRNVVLQSALDELTTFLRKLVKDVLGLLGLGSGSPALDYKTVKQENCDFSENICES